MADYFTNFSLIVPLPSEDAVNYALELAEQAFHAHMGEAIPDEFPASLRDVIEDWQFDTDSNDPSNARGLWLHSSDGGIDAVCAFIQHLLQRFTPENCVQLEWSNDCSKPRVDAFGGGAAIITADRIKSMSTGEWLHRQLTRLQRPQMEGQPSPVKLHVNPNAETGAWEIHDECGFLCKLESESTAALIIHAVNVLPKIVAALEMAEPAVAYHHEREGCPITLNIVRGAIRRANHINPPPAFRRRQKQKGKQHHGRNS